MKTVKIVLLASLFSTAAFADFTLNVHFGAMYGANASTSIGVDKIGVLVVSTLGNAFPQGAALEGLALTQNSDWGNGIFVMNVMSSVNVGVDKDGAGPGLAVNTSSFAGTLPNVVTTGFGGNFTVNDQFGLYWFPSITDTNAASGTANVTPSRSIAQGDIYGFYRTDTVQMGSFVVANTAFAATSLTGSGIRLQARSDDSLTDAQIVTVGASPNPNITDFVASLSVPVVPEPSTYAVIFGMLTLGVAIYRRKK